MNKANESQKQTLSDVSGIIISVALLVISLPLLVASCGVALPFVIGLFGVAVAETLTFASAIVGVWAGVSSLIGFSLLTKKCSAKLRLPEHVEKLIQPMQSNALSLC